MPESPDTALWWLVVRALVVAGLVLILGGLVLRAMLAGTPARETPLSSPEQWFLRLVLGLGGVGWLTVLLAELGRFSFSWLLGLGVAISVAIRVIGGGSGRQAPGPGGGVTHARAIGVLCLLAGWLYFPAYETALWASDATVYLSFARQISETGAFLFDDGFLASLDPDTRRSLFLNYTLSDVTGTYARFPGGFLIPDIDAARVTAGFSPLFPGLLALFHLLFGASGFLFVGPVFATLGVCGLYFLGARLSGPWTGMLAATLLAVSAPQVWFARFPLPAVVSQCFVLAGLMALLVSLQHDRPRVALGAGGLLGVAVLAKFDLVAVLPVTAIVVLGAAAWTGKVSAGQRWSVAISALAGLAVPLLHTALHFLVFPSHYAPFLTRMFELSRLWTVALPLAAAGLAAVLVLVGIGRAARAWLWQPQRRRRMAGLVALALLAAYAVAYVNASDNRLAETTAWLMWYLSWPVVALAGVGFGSALWQWWRGRPHVGRLVVLALVGVACGHYLYDPHEATDLIWSLRRFVPIVIPGLLLVASLVVADATARLPAVAPRGLRAVATALVCGGLVFLVGRPAGATFRTPLWEDGLATSRAIAEQFPDGSVVLVGSELAGIHLQTTLAYLHDVDTLLLQPSGLDALTLETAVLTWVRAGRPVFVVVDPAAPLFFAPRLLATVQSDVDLQLSVLESTTTRRPTAIERRRATLQVMQLANKGPVRASSLDLGVPGEDRLFLPRGFHAAERDPDPRLSTSTYRWSSAVATLRLPQRETYRFLVSGGRPEGAPAAEISIWIDGRQATDATAVPNAPVTITVPSPVSGERPNGVEVTIRSTVFNPSALGLSRDSRDLGTRLYQIGFSGAPATGQFGAAGR